MMKEPGVIREWLSMEIAINQTERGRVELILGRGRAK